jgi:hypothetical protein
VAAAVTLCAFSVALSLAGGGAPSYYPHVVVPLGPLVLSSTVLLAVLVALPAAGSPWGAARAGDVDG